MDLNPYEVPGPCQGRRLLGREASSGGAWTQEPWSPRLYLAWTKEKTILGAEGFSRGQALLYWGKWGNSQLWLLSWASLSEVVHVPNDKGFPTACFSSSSRLG